MSDLSVAKTEQRANDASTLRDWVRHPGYAIFEKRLAHEMKVNLDRWMDAKSAAEAEELRQAGKPYHCLQLIIKKVLMEGDAAALRLGDKTEEDLA